MPLRTTDEQLGMIMGYVPMQRVEHCSALHLYHCITVLCTCSPGLAKLKWAYRPVYINMYMYMYTVGRYSVYPRRGWTWSRDTIVLREIQVHVIAYSLWENVQEGLQVSYTLA